MIDLKVGELILACKHVLTVIHTKSDYDNLDIQMYYGFDEQTSKELEVEFKEPVRVALVCKACVEDESVTTIDDAFRWDGTIGTLEEICL